MPNQLIVTTAWCTTTSDIAPIHFGYLVCDHQVIDIVGATDLLHSTSKRVITAGETFGPLDDDTLARAPKFVFHHIGLICDLVHLLASAITIVPTTTIDECPGLDCLLIGGPNPAYFELHPQGDGFIRRHVAAGKLFFSSALERRTLLPRASWMATINDVEYNTVGLCEGVYSTEFAGGLQH